MLTLPTFSEFREQVKSFAAASGGSVATDDSDLIVVSEGIARSVSLDKLYRAFVDAQLRNPSMGQADVLNAVLAASDNYRAANHHKPIFNITARILPLSGGGMMQKCVSG
jgi:hypothetical protein